MSMTSWENQFQELKQQFIVRSKERLSAIENLLDQMQYRPGDYALLRNIRQHFHWMAGSGGTYGFDEITQWGTYGEELCEYLLKLQVPVKPEDREKLQSAFETVQILFAAASPEQASNNTRDDVQQLRSTEDLLVSPKQNDLRQEISGSTFSSNYQNTGEYRTDSSVPGSHFYRNDEIGVPANSWGANSAQPSAAPESNSPPNNSSAAAPDQSSRGNASSESLPPGNSPSSQSLWGGSSPPSSNAAGSSWGSTGQYNVGGLQNPSATGAPPNQSSGSSWTAGNPSSYTGAWGATSSGGASGGAWGANNPNTAGNVNAYAGAWGAAGSQNNQTPGAFESRNTQEVNISQNPLNSSAQGTAASQKQTSSHPISVNPPVANPMPDQGRLPPSAGPPLTSGASVQEPPSVFGGGIRQTGEFARPRLMHVPPNQVLAIMLDSGQTNLSVVKTMLEEKGIHVETFNSASVVRTLFAERIPDYFFVTIPLPDNDGYELVEYLRNLEGGHRPTIFMLSQQAAFLDKVMAIRAGADSFFEYPGQHQDLVQKVTDVTDRNQNPIYKILSVEDDQNQADFIKLTLETAGYQVLHIADPKRFEDTFLSYEPDLVLLDVMLGDMTGFELAKYIRQNDRFVTVPIVFLTTQNKLHQHVRSAVSGGDEHLVKPVAPQLLIATVASRLERARALKKLIDRDGLTKCLNYGTFMERAIRMAAPENIRNAPAMMMIDIDNMGAINEQLGFAIGDRIISSISNILLKGFRSTDLIGRFGNDQFAIVLDHLSDVQLQSLASQVLGAISNTPQLVKGQKIAATCSCGVAALEPGMTLAQWIEAAEDALQKAKHGGKNRAIVRPTGKGQLR